MSLSLHFYGPQTADEYDGYPEGTPFLYAEAKFDGYRLCAVIAKGEVTFYCREQKPVAWGKNLDHIARELLELGFDNCMVDGEVMMLNWNETGLIKRGCSKLGYKRPPDAVMAQIEAEAKMHAFDWVDLPAVKMVEGYGKKMVPVFGMPLKERKQVLASYIGHANQGFSKIVLPVITHEVTSHADVLMRMEHAIDFGYEGLVLKFPGSVYTFRENKAWRKLKEAKTFEVEVLEAVEGEGKYVGMLGTLKCRMKDGTIVFVGTGTGGAIDDKQRRLLWAAREDLPGRIAEVKAQATDVSAARHPRLFRWRDDKESL